MRLPNSSQQTSETPPSEEAIPWHALTETNLIYAPDAAGLEYYLSEIAHQIDCRLRRYAWIIVGDNRKVLPVLAKRFPQRLGGGVTSPPYFGQRDNGCGEHQIGLGKFADYVDDLDIVNGNLLELLRPDASLWEQIGDKSAGGGNGQRGKTSSLGDQKPSQKVENKFEKLPDGYKRRESLDLPGICRASGRRGGFLNPATIVWDKGKPAARSCKTCLPPSSERIVWLAKSDQWYFNRERLLRYFPHCTGDVWHFPPNRNQIAKDYGVDHSSTFPPQLATACLAVSTRPRDWIIDPFGGLGNTALGALPLQLNSLLIEQNPEYACCAAHILQSLPAYFRPRITLLLTDL